MECKDERQTNGTRKLNGLLNNNQAAFRKTGELEFRQGNQVQEMHELHDTARQVQYSLKQRNGAKLREKPEYEEVDDENSKFGPNSIEQHQRPAFYFLTQQTPQQAVDRPVLTNNHNNNGRLQEEAPVAPEN
uniref:Uncharacterized protein n=1 Tax=Ditylenchus dipsaci TaxID=166011 RepID=A0A915CNC6_9BILA